MATILLLLPMLLFVQIKPTSQHDIYIPNLPAISYKKHGDFDLGVLFPVHYRKYGDFCSTEVQNLGVLQRLEAIAYAIDTINADPTVLKNYTLGYIIYDDCATDITAMAQTMHFVRTKPGIDTCSVGESYRQEAFYCNESVENYDIIGLLGSENSLTTTEACKMMTFFRRPHISYLATTTTLSNIQKYPFFQRVVPSDYYQVKAILDMLIYFQWTFVNVLFSSGEYGEQAVKVLAQQAEGTNVCFNMVRELRDDMDRADYRNIIRDIINDETVNVSVVLVFASSDKGHELLRAASSLLPAKGRITWIASNAWGDEIAELQDNVKNEAIGMLSIDFFSSNVPHFDQDFQEIHANSSTRNNNPWLDEFWRKYHNCTTYNRNSKEVRQCSGSVRLADHSSYTPERKISLIFDAVYMYAYAIDLVIKHRCEKVLREDMYQCVETHLPDALKTIEFQSIDGTTVQFDKYGNRYPARYKIYNVQFTAERGHHLVHVMSWDALNQTLTFTGNDIQWTTGHHKPESVCSNACQSDEGIVYQQKRCCWDCEKCRENQVIRKWPPGSERWFCFDCNPDEWPNATDRTQCVPIKPSWLAFSDPLGIGMASTATVGIIVCLVVFVLFTINRQHELIKASSRELMYLILLGMIVCYMFVYTFLVKPSQAVCLVKFVGISLSFTLIYSPMTCKSIRIYRLFKIGRYINKKPLCVGFKSQMVLATSIVLFHALLLGIYCIFSRPSVETIIPHPSIRQLICNFPFGPSIMAFVFNCILLIVCALFAFMTRGLPDNFNESRFIAFCVYSTILVWFALVPALVTASTSSVRNGLLSAILLLNATVPLVTIFIPKLYAVYFIKREKMHLRKHNFHPSTKSQFHENLDSVAPDLVSTTTPSVGKERACVVKRISDLSHVYSSSKVVPVVPEGDGEGDEGWM